MDIKRIIIENIKGFGTSGNIIDVNIKPNKYNLLVAPNGFGKSSIAAAFNSLNLNRLSINKEIAHNQDATLLDRAKIKIILDDGTTLEADNSRNEISNYFKVYVINSSVTVKASGKHIGKYIQPHGEMIIPPVVLESNIPKSDVIAYSYNTIKNKFTSNGGLLPNITKLLNNKSFLCELPFVFNEFEKFSKNSRKIDLVNKVIDEIETARDKSLIAIKYNYYSDSFSKLKSNEGYKKIRKILETFTDYDNDLDKFLSFYQLLLLYKKDKQKFKNKCQRAEYEVAKQKFNKDLESLDTTGQRLKAVESEGKLVLKFPKANRISNGQRDLISLFSKLFYFKNRIKAGKRYLLIIDEVFDYLDDANFIASQYYLSEIVNTKKAPVYVIILTHLSPRYFHSNIFSSKKLNMQFLDKKLSIDNSPLVDVIAFRNKQDNNSKLYNDISAYIFHFNSEAKELKEDFINQHASQIALKYSSSESIHKYVFQQLSQYENNETYDCI